MGDSISTQWGQCWGSGISTTGILRLSFFFLFISLSPILHRTFTKRIDSNFAWPSTEPYYHPFHKILHKNHFIKTNTHSTTRIYTTDTKRGTKVVQVLLTLGSEYMSLVYDLFIFAFRQLFGLNFTFIYTNHIYFMFLLSLFIKYYISMLKRKDHRILNLQNIHMQ